MYRLNILGEGDKKQSHEQEKKETKKLCKSIKIPKKNLEFIFLLIFSYEFCLIDILIEGTVQKTIMALSVDERKKVSVNVHSNVKEILGTVHKNPK